MKLSRKQLYQLIWAVPTDVLAQALRVTPSNVLKHCKRHEVPTPGRGYWRISPDARRLRHQTLSEPEMQRDLILGANVLGDGAFEDFLAGLVKRHGAGKPVDEKVDAPSSTSAGLLVSDASQATASEATAPREVSAKSPMAPGKDDDLACKPATQVPPLAWKSPLDATGDLRVLVDQDIWWRAAGDFLQLVEGAIPEQSGALADALGLWLRLAREELIREHPQYRLLASCQRFVGAFDPDGSNGCDRSSRMPPHGVKAPA
ncbi:MAG: hypothetical protein Tsb007_15530 [Rhizobacter sp.]